MRKFTLVLVALVAILVNAACGGGGGSSTPTSPTPTTNPTSSTKQVSVVVTNVVTRQGVPNALIVSDSLKDANGKLKEFRTSSLGVVVIEVPSNAGAIDIVITVDGHHGPFETTLSPDKTAFVMFEFVGNSNADRVSETIFGDGRDIANPGIVSTSKPGGNISIVYSPDQNIPASDLAVLQESMDWMAIQTVGAYKGKVETQATNPVVYNVVVDPKLATPGMLKLKYNSAGEIASGTYHIRGDGKLTKGTARHEALHMLGLFHHRGVGLLGELGEDVPDEMSQMEKDLLRYLLAMPTRTRHVRNDRGVVGTAALSPPQDFAFVCK
jgi:hypothetical protein